LTPDKQLDILHDHYKETFARIRESEAARDRLLLWSIVLFAVLSLEIGYPATIGKSLGKVTFLGTEMNLQPLPLAALLTATWVLTLAVSLRYCQTATLVSRQYQYLHLLEENISPIVRGSKQYQTADNVIGPLLHENIYQREGKVYLNEYPLLLDVAWFAYVILFPGIMMVAAAGLAGWEWFKLSYPVFHRVFDALLALAIITFFFLYRVQPFVWQRWKARREGRKKSRKITPAEALPVEDI